jgi:predicted CxxxxCH...CXXCH cytochrome family protein
MVLLATACDGASQRPEVPRAALGVTTNAALAGPGSGTHDLSAANGFTCDACHPCGKRSPDGHALPWMQTADAGFHAFRANGGLGACQPCHGPALDGVGGTTSVSCAQCHGAGWKSACTMCHGGTDGPSGAPPATTWGNAADAVRVGTHTSHLAATHGLGKPVTCATCHPIPADALSPGHVDGGSAEVVFAGLPMAPAGPPAWDRTSGRCANVYCHGATLSGGAAATPLWTLADGTQRACGACHGAPPPAPHPVNPACGECHPGYGQDAVDPELHIDGKLDATLTCSSCHGSATSAAPPRGTRLEVATTTRAVGAHQAHLAGGTLAAPVACSECHAVPAAMAHSDGTVQLAWGPLATARAAVPAFDPATLTCSNYCHGATLAAGGSNSTPSWTTVDGTQDACGTCHGSPPPAPHTANPDCGLCHVGYTQTSVVVATHVNGVLDVKDLTCTSCHGSAQNAAPPMGTLGETDTASRAVGAHQQHLVAGTLRGPIACEECHVVPTAMDHADATVQLAFGPLARTDGAQAIFDATSLTCSNYCHGAILRGGGTNLAPLWTGGLPQVTCGSCHMTPPPAPHPHTAVCDNCHPGYSLGSVNLTTHINGLVEADNLTCASCHGDTSRVLVMQADPLAIAAPPFGSRGELDPTARSVGQHQAHVNRGDGLALPNKCRYCHAVPPEGAFDHANGTSEVTFGSLATMDGATPTFDGNACANTYCHGATLGRGGTDHSPTWTSPAAVTCGSCHGVPPPLPHPQDQDCVRCHPGYTATSVRKWTHVNGVSDFPSGCNSCHDIPPNTGEHYEHLHERIACDRCHAGYTTTTANETLHRNARQDVTLAGWNPTSRTCSSISCHGSEYWGRTGTAARQSCNQCHGVPPRSGEHYEHSEYACSRCHGTGYSTTTTNTATHLNTVVDVPYAFYNKATNACSNLGCHSSKTWGTRVPVTPNCSNCHGFPPPLPHPDRSDCQSCHPSMQPTGVLTADHNNGTLDIAGSGCVTCHGFPPTSTRSGGLHTADANCYGCHSTTVDASNEIVPNGTHNDGYVQVGGGGVGTYGCQSCHGDQAREASVGADPHLKSAPPLGTRGESDATTRAVGAHLAHVSPAVGSLAAPAACAECHVVPTAMDHAMGTVMMAFGPRATSNGAFPAWDPATLTCATTYCHGSTLNAGGTNHLPSWTGGPAEATCGSCHGAPPPPPHSTSTSCGTCHSGYTATSVNLATHVDGVVQSGAHPEGYAAGAVHGYEANLHGLAGCKSCHGGSLTGDFGPSCATCHASAGHAAWDTSCTFCHGSTVTGRQNPPVDIQGRSATTNVSVGVHEAHATTPIAVVACAQCHPARTASVVTDAAHVDGNGVAEVQLGALAKTGGAAATYTRTSATSASCASVYCHGRFTGGTGATVSWTSTTQVSCSSCHGNPPSTGEHPRHVSSKSIGCYVCHNAVVSSSKAIIDATLHVNGADNVRFGGTYSSRTVTGTWNASTRTCSSLSCHGSETW